MKAYIKKLALPLLFAGIILLLPLISSEDIQKARAATTTSMETTATWSGSLEAEKVLTWTPGKDAYYKVTLSSEDERGIECDIKSDDTEEDNNFLLVKAENQSSRYDYIRMNAGVTYTIRLNAYYGNAASNVSLKIEQASYITLTGTTKTFTMKGTAPRLLKYTPKATGYYEITETFNAVTGDEANYVFNEIYTIRSGKAKNILNPVYTSENDRILGHKVYMEKGKLYYILAYCGSDSSLKVGFSIKKLPDITGYTISSCIKNAYINDMFAYELDNYITFNVTYKYADGTTETVKKTRLSACDIRIDYSKSDIASEDLKLTEGKHYVYLTLSNSSLTKKHSFTVISRFDFIQEKYGTLLVDQDYSVSSSKKHTTFHRAFETTDSGYYCMYSMGANSYWKHWTLECCDENNEPVDYTENAKGIAGFKLLAGKKYYLIFTFEDRILAKTFTFSVHKQYDIPDLNKATITSLTTDSDGINLVWKNVGAEEYRVYRKVEDGSYRKVCVTPRNKWTDDDIVTGRKYTYYVVAYGRDEFTNKLVKSSTSSKKSITY